MSGNGIGRDVDLPPPTKKRKTLAISTISYADAIFILRDTALPHTNNNPRTYYTLAPFLRGKRKREEVEEEAGEETEEETEEKKEGGVNYTYNHY